MFTRSYSVYVEPPQVYFRSSETVSIQPKRRPILIRFATLAFLSLVMSMLGVVAVARTEPLPRLMDVPQTYLPGNPLPRNVVCYTPADEHYPRCSVSLSGYEVYFNFDADTGK